MGNQMLRMLIKANLIPFVNLICKNIMDKIMNITGKHKKMNRTLNYIV